MIPHIHTHIYSDSPLDWGPGMRQVGWLWPVWYKSAFCLPALLLCCAALVWWGGGYATDMQELRYIPGILPDNRRILCSIINIYAVCYVCHHLAEPL